MTPKFNPGDAVRRPVDIMAPIEEWKYKEGVVLERYDYHSPNFGYYPELYAVRWQDGKEERGFLPHGLDKVN